MKCLILLLLYSVIFSPNESLASPCTSVSVTTQDVTLTWDGSTILSTAYFTITKSGADSCRAIIGMTKGNSASYDRDLSSAGTDTVEYQLYTSSTDFTYYIKDAQDQVNVNEGYSIDFGAGDNVSVQLIYYIRIKQVSVESPVYRSHGAYQDGYAINVYDPGNLVQPLTTRVVQLSLTVPPILDVSLVPYGYAFSSNSTTYTLDLGDLARVTTGNLDIVVRTNTGCSVLISSVNNGRLLNTSNSLSYILYSFVMNGIYIPLTSVPTQILSSSSNTSTDGVSNHVSISSIPGINPLAGEYDDTINITIQPY
jgi:spore coat protein U-like protein